MFRWKEQKRNDIKMYTYVAYVLININYEDISASHHFYIEKNVKHINEIKLFITLYLLSFIKVASLHK